MPEQPIPNGGEDVPKSYIKDPVKAEHMAYAEKPFRERAQQYRDLQQNVLEAGEEQSPYVQQAVNEERVHLGVAETSANRAARLKAEETGQAYDKGELSEPDESDQSTS